MLLPRHQLLPQILVTSEYPVTRPQRKMDAAVERIIMYMRSDLPQSFDAAEADFRRFLAKHQYPPNIEWRLIKHVIIDESGRYFVRRCDKRSRFESERRYHKGVQNGLGVQLRAICVSDAKTVACVDVPEDLTDAQYRMIGPGLKMSCPVQVVDASEVPNRVRWYVLRLSNYGRSRLLRSL